MTDIVLASKSPRRRELFNLVTNTFTVTESNIDEEQYLGLPIRLQVQSLAREKCIIASRSYPKSVIIGCDTLVGLGKQVFGKPVDANDAARMLNELQNKTHTVFTGVCIKQIDDLFEFYCTTEVTFNAMSKEEIKSYVATGDPLDKAGAYGIQQGAAKHIQRIDGDYYNAVGLPVSKLYEVLKERGII